MLGDADAIDVPPRAEGDGVGAESAPEEEAPVDMRSSALFNELTEGAETSSTSAISEAVGADGGRVGWWTGRRGTVLASDVNCASSLARAAVADAVM